MAIENIDKVYYATWNGTLLASEFTWENSVKFLLQMKEISPKIWGDIFVEWQCFLEQTQLYLC